jgi:O-methyltransferase involved in polyketide biosynthesis
VFREHGFAKPANLIRVPLDLEQRRLGEYLLACGFDLEAASFCSALGLMQYLDDEMVDDILRFVASHAPSSEIVFTFVLPDDDLDASTWNLRAARRLDSAK